MLHHSTQLHIINGYQCIAVCICVLDGSGSGMIDQNIDYLYVFTCFRFNFWQRVLDLMSVECVCAFPSETLNEICIIESMDIHAFI